LNQQLKQRIIGAIVLISLAIIFIPALLDGSHKNVSPLKERQTPQKPNFYFEEIKLPASVEPGAAPSRIVDSSKDIAPPKQATKPAKSTAKKVAKVKSDKVSPKIEKPPVTSAKSDVTSPAPSVWVVQIVSLTNSKRALELRDKLKKQTFPAFVEELTKDGKKFYRVRVGPELTRGEAEVLQQKIKKKMKLDGRVMRYQPL